MLCQNCGKNEATMYFRQTVNGQTKEMHLCPECADQLGVNNQFAQSFHSSFAKPFGSWFDDVFHPAVPVAVRRTVFADRTAWRRQTLPDVRHDRIGIAAEWPRRLRRLL